MMLRLNTLLTAFVVGFLGMTGVACGQAPRGPVQPTGASPEASGWATETVVEGLNRPWGMAWLPDGQTMLITERSGSLRLIRDGSLIAAPVAGVPGALAHGQGGLMDVVLHPSFERNRWVYLTMSTGTREANRTALVRGVLSEDATRLVGARTLFEVSQDKPGGQHFGSRLLWLPDGTLLMSIGDGGNPPTEVEGQHVRLFAQDVSSHFGKTLRLTEDGEPAANNPFSGHAEAAAEVFTYGHRNIQGMAIDPATGTIYATEHGARGGDELNILTPGTNYGWPAATYSIEYWGPRISDIASMPGAADPEVVWTPCIAPSGLTFYTGDRYPAWRGDLFAGGLVLRQIRRIDLENGRVVGQETLSFDERVRDVRQGPDGFMYVLTDAGNGELLRIVTASE
ncbi:PQQ-dependent sugar dehydrogenase [Mucisphaera sp.]|uniref:PQQ-dependent sugar dehydrogenase n=1 Tax=Mucisphaera sp. TaxID=2913024 RepID=UPI003D1179D4